MSIKVADRVWKYSRHRGALKLLLIALAEHANDNGICWPGVEQLAERINESKRYTRQLLSQIEEDGSIVRVIRPGRGNTTVYAITVGMTDQERQQEKGALECRYFEKKEALECPHTEEKGHCGTPIPEEKEALQCTKRGTTVSADLEGSEATESAETAQNSEDNRHEPSWDLDLGSRNHDSVDHAPPPKETPSVPKDDPLFAALVEVCNYSTALLSQRQFTDLQQTYQQFHNAETQAEQMQRFGPWWHDPTLNWRARKAAEAKRQLGPPLPFQVLESWPEFTAQQPARASPVPELAAVTGDTQEPKLTGEELKELAKQYRPNGVVHVQPSSRDAP